MADIQVQQAVQEAKANQRIHRLAERVAKRHVLLANDTHRKEFEERCKEIIRWVRWDCVRWLNDNGDASEKPGQYCHTSKPMTDAIKSADGFVGHAFGDDPWVGVQLADWRLNEPVGAENPIKSIIDVSQRWLQQVTRWLTSHYRYGSFMVIQPTTTLDAHTFGPALTYTHLQGREIIHQRCNVLNAFMKRGADLGLNQTHYLEPWMAGEAYEKWGDKLSPETCRAAISEPQRRVWIMRCVYRVSDPILDDIPITMDDGWTHYEVLIEKDSVKNGSAYDSQDPFCGVLEHNGHPENPFACWQYFLPDAEDAYGWSAYGLALISIKRAHLFWKSAMYTAEAAGDPAMKTTLRNTKDIDLRPGRFSKLMNPNDILEEAYKRPANYPFQIDFLQHIESQLEEVLHIPLYQAMSLRDHEMRVAEVLEVIGEKVRMLSPRIGTRQLLYDNPIHERTLELARAMDEGPINSPPRELVEYLVLNKLNPRFRFTYKGPLAQWNEISLMARTLSTNIELLTGIATLGDKAAIEVQDTVKAGVLAEYVVDHANLPQAAIATEDEKAQTRTQRQMETQAQTALVAMQAAQQASMADKNQAQTAQIMQGGR